MKITPTVLRAVSLVLLAVLAVPASCQDCPCQMSSSTIYPGMFVWDCSELALTAVPDGCFSIRKDNISEFILTRNSVKEIRSTSLAELGDVRVLMLDYNDLDFVDVTAFEFMHDLEVISFDHNLDLSLEFDTLAGLDKLREFSSIGTSMGQLPNIAISPVLSRVDARSSELVGLPLELLSPSLNSTSFYLNLNGNDDMLDIAASSLLGLPDDTILNLDTFVVVWSRTEEQKEDLLSRPWTVNIDLQAASRVCEADGLPGDLAICYD